MTLPHKTDSIGQTDVTYIQSRDILTKTSGFLDAYDFTLNPYHLVGVVVLRRYIDILIIINFPYSTCITSFFGSSIPTSLFIFKMFFRSCFCYFFTI